MLQYLHIRNLALVTEADLEFSPGFNAVTGETGAGKSVLMGGIRLLLGGRFDKDSIRSGETRCEVAGEFTCPEELRGSVNALLEESGVEIFPEGNVLIRRVFTSSGGRIFVNGSPVTLKLIASLGQFLADIHHAGEASGLLHPAEQLHSLDRFSGTDPERASCAAAWEELRQAKAAQEAFLHSMPSASEAETLRSALEAIAKVNPSENEDELLARKHETAANAREILETAQVVTAMLTESEDSVRDRISQVRRSLQELERTDPARAEVFLEKCGDLAEEISILSGEVSDYASSVELDGEAFAALEERMTAIQTLKRKYGPSLADVLAFREESTARLDAFDHSSREQARLEAAVRAAEQKHLAACKVLSGKRKRAADPLAALLKQEILKLGFRHASISIAFSEAQPGPNGSDRIEILFSANPGVPQKELRCVASSGELSRVMLAVKTVLAGADRIPTLVFDEIDANIGGETASAVAEELALLGKSKQILSISHLAQVAAAADRHFQVVKLTSEDRAVSTAHAVTGPERIAEIARMLGGGTAAETHARSLLKRLHAEKRA